VAGGASLILQPISMLDQEELAKLKPQAGDTVLYEGTRYVVDQAGLKYVNMHREDNPKALGFVRYDQISKVFEEPPEDLDLENWKAGITSF
jgi:hypothetical protein